MLHLLQTIKERGTNNLFLYLGIDMYNDGVVHLVDESGTHVLIANKTFFKNCTHVEKEGDIKVGAYAIPEFLGVVVFEEGMIPDLELKQSLVEYMRSLDFDPADFFMV